MFIKRNIDFNPFFLKILNLNSRVEFLFSNFEKISISNSLSFEDLFLVYFITLKKKKFKLFFLNTGRLFNNFLNFFNKVFKIFSNQENFFSNYFLINKYIKKYSFNSFYNNIVLRKLCCYIRKIENYNKLVFDYDVVLTGQRMNRVISNSNSFNFDNSRNLIKYNLLYSWDYKDIFYFIEKFNILVNFIYNYGYISLGCDPCTKKIFSQDYIRGGRWWWEIKKGSKKECGLHL